MKVLHTKGWRSKLLKGAAALVLAASVLITGCNMDDDDDEGGRGASNGSLTLKSGSFTGVAHEETTGVFTFTVHGDYFDAPLVTTKDYAGLIRIKAGDDYAKSVHVTSDIAKNAGPTTEITVNAVLVSTLPAKGNVTVFVDGGLLAGGDTVSATGTGDVGAYAFSGALIEGSTLKVSPEQAFEAVYTVSLVDHTYSDALKALDAGASLESYLTVAVLDDDGDASADLGTLTLTVAEKANDTVLKVKLSGTVATEYLSEGTLHFTLLTGAVSGYDKALVCSASPSYKVAGAFATLSGVSDVVKGTGNTNASFTTPTLTVTLQNKTFAADANGSVVSAVAETLGDLTSVTANNFTVSADRTSATFTLTGTIASITESSKTGTLQLLFTLEGGVVIAADETISWSITYAAAKAALAASPEFTTSTEGELSATKTYTVQLTNTTFASELTPESFTLANDNPKDGVTIAVTSVSRTSDTEATVTIAATGTLSAATGSPTGTLTLKATAAATSYAAELSIGTINFALTFEGSYAQVGNVIISGKSNIYTQLTVTVGGTTFKAMTANTTTDYASGANQWFTNVPAGLNVYLLYDVADGATTATFIVSGTATANGTEVIAGAVPASATNKGVAITLTENANAKWNVSDTAPYVKPITAANCPRGDQRQYRFSTTTNYMDMRATTASTRPYYVLVELVNAKFNEIDAGAEVDWVTNVPDSCTVTVSHGNTGGNNISNVNANDTIAYLAITPKNAPVFLPEYVNIRIPASYLTIESDVYATAQYRMQISPTLTVSGAQSITLAAGGTVTVTLQSGYKFADNPTSTDAYAYSFNAALCGSGNARYDFKTTAYAIPKCTWSKVTDSTATITFDTTLAGAGSTYDPTYFLEIMLPAGSIETADGTATAFTPSTVGTGSSTSSIAFSAGS